jgi:TnpA family transposase
MTLIDRTAYPRFKPHLSAKELSEIYTPTQPEIELAYANARGTLTLVNFVVLLKCFQRLGYFPKFKDVPTTIKKHIQVCLALPHQPTSEPASPETGTEQLHQPSTPPPPPRSLYRYHQAIRTYLKVKIYDENAEKLITTTIRTLAYTRNYPADLINAAVEILVKERYELPAFSTLDLLVQNLRNQVNSELYQKVADALFREERQKLDGLLTTQPEQTEPAWGRLRALPKSATLTNLQELISHYTWLLSLGEVERALAPLSQAKIQDFAAQARTLKPSELSDYTPARRYTLMACLIHRSRTHARDNLVETFLKRIAFLHNKAKEELESIRDRQRTLLEKLLGVFTQILQVGGKLPQLDESTLGKLVQQLVQTNGGWSTLLEECEAITAYNGNNYYPLLHKYYRSHRSTLFSLIGTLEFVSTSQDKTNTSVLAYLRLHQTSTEELLPYDLSFSLDFLSEKWQRLVFTTTEDGERKLVRKHLEICLFSYLATELKTGDLAVVGAEQFADYRLQLLSWKECQPLLDEYCLQAGLPNTAQELVRELKERLTKLAEQVDQNQPHSDQFTLGTNGVPVLKKVPATHNSKNLAALEAALREKMPPRSVLEILANLHYYTGWTRHFGPISGAEPKLERPLENYILTAFSFGCNLGPAQLTRHLRENVQPGQLSYINLRHVDEAKLEAARRDIINSYANFELPRRWGDGSRAGADGTKFELVRDNLVSEYHIRYGGFGGIAYQHISDTYIALFSRFATCGTWEAVIILDLFNSNKSAIQPDTLHADTQGQNAPVFGLSHLLGVKLMPRIRNWQDLIFYRPLATTRYQHIDHLFRETVNWDLIEKYWPELMRVALSIKAGKIIPSTLLRKLNNYSHKNKLYQAMRELGMVIRTIFLLQYITDEDLRRIITATTNKVEAFNGFIKWLFFGSEGMFGDNNSEEQQKRLAYLHVVANAVIYQNVVDMSRVLEELAKEGLEFSEEDVAALSPYLTHHIKRFGEYVLDVNREPAPFDGRLRLNFSKPEAKASNQ